ncbi:hypothetical protein DOY81_007827 [Sarcophaga bullata]|nr:hypothetical protein DOY81_007827 [Sarcophaga bullata]
MTIKWRQKYKNRKCMQLQQHEQCQKEPKIVVATPATTAAIVYFNRENNNNNNNNIKQNSSSTSTSTCGMSSSRSGSGDCGACSINKKNVEDDVANMSNLTNGLKVQQQQQQQQQQQLTHKEQQMYSANCFAKTSSATSNSTVTDSYGCISFTKKTIEKQHQLQTHKGIECKDQQQQQHALHQDLALSLRAPTAMVALENAITIKRRHTQKQQQQENQLQQQLKKQYTDTNTNSNSSSNSSNCFHIPSWCATIVDTLLTPLFTATTNATLQTKKTTTPSLWIETKTAATIMDCDIQRKSRVIVDSLHMKSTLATTTTTTSTTTTTTTMMTHHKLPTFFILFICLFATNTTTTTTTAAAAATSSATSSSTSSLSSSTAFATLNNSSIQPQESPVVAAVSSLSSSSPSSSSSLSSSLTPDLTAKSLPMLASTIPQCSLSEHSCTNGRCVPLSKYCNNINDCGDGSDEPRFCTLDVVVFTRETNKTNEKQRQQQQQQQ